MAENENSSVRIAYVRAVVYLLPQDTQRDAAIVACAQSFGGVLYDVDVGLTTVEVWFEFFDQTAADLACRAFQGLGWHVEDWGCWEDRGEKPATHS